MLIMVCSADLCSSDLCAALILYGGILFLPLSATGPPAVLLVAVLEKLIDIMNLLMQFFSRLPGAVLGGIWIHPAECAGLYLLIGCMIIFFLSRNGNWLRAALVILVILVAASAIESYRQDRQRRLISSSEKDTSELQPLMRTSYA